MNAGRVSSLLAAFAAIGLALAMASCSGGSRAKTDAGDGAAPAGDSGIDSAPGGEPDAGDAAVDSPTGGIPGHCGDGTVFCNSACGICVLVGGPCRIDTCGNGDGGEACGNGPRCGDGTHCVNFTCVPR
jgi:hypothetical protein